MAWTRKLGVRWFGTVVAAAGTLVLLPLALSCASSDPQVSGIGLFNNRNVSVGDLVEISLPLGNAENPEWRLTSYDSGLLGLRSRPSVERSGDADPKLVLIFIAKSQGDTDVVLERSSTDGGLPERKVFHIMIH